MARDSTHAVLEPDTRRYDGAFAAQQPRWRDHPHYRASRATLAAAPALVTRQEIETVQRSLAQVAEGHAQVLQIGDCAESFDEVDDDTVGAKLALLHTLAEALVAGTGDPVLRIGRLGGQFAKPRSESVERIAGLALPVFRGHMVNSEEPTPQAREHDPRRMVRAYLASAGVLDRLRADRAARADGPWASHDALVLDYEANLVRTDAGARLLGSTHLPWIGDRTRQPDSAHVRLLSTVANPVACKVGPSTSIPDLLGVCARLDPDRIPGRLALIVRLGANAVTDLLPPIVTSVRARGHPVVWLCDPMHGNTVRLGDNVKTRRLADITAEALGFRRVLAQHGAHAGGLHLEVASAHVTECLGGDVRGTGQLRSRYTTLCDPRLNPDQAATLLRSWLES